MMKIFKYFLFAVLFLNLYSETQVHAKPVPPGSGEGDVPANILFLIDSSASMSRRISNRDAVFGVTGEIESLVITQQDGQGNLTILVKQVLALILQVAQDILQFKKIREQEQDQKLEWLQICRLMTEQLVAKI